MSSILQALREMKEEVIAKGLLVKMFKAKFISAIYILNEVLPILSTLSRTFQAGTINYARIEPSISYTMDALNGVLEIGSPVTKMEEDLQEGGRLFTLGLHPGEHEVTQMKILRRKYIEALQSNIRDRFDDVTPLLSSFCMFDPTLAPNRGDDNFYNYGEEQIKMISKHFYGETQEDQTQLTAEWKQFKYHFEKMKETSQYLESTTPTEYCLRHILQLTTPFGQSFPLLSKVAEIILSMPISNAWPERGASAVKRIKTRLRNRLSNKMLETVMQVNINGPETTSAAAETIVKQTVKQWYEAKQRRKLPKCEEKPKEGEEVPTFTVEQRDVSTQADIGVPEQDIQEKVQEVLKLLNIRSKELVSESSESEESEEEEADYEIEKELEFEHVEQN